MNTAHRLEFFTDDDGNPWACFAWGEVPPETITRERIAEAADYYEGFVETELDLDNFTVQAMWIQNGSDEETWVFCDADAPGAERITGVRFS